MAIFTHTDCDGDGFELLADPDDSQEDLVLLYRNKTGRSAGACRLDQDAVVRLYQALGEHLFPVHTHEGLNGTLIEELIAKAVKDLVTAVLPLHLSPVATSEVAQESAPCTELLRPGTRLMDQCSFCGHLWVTHRPVPVGDTRPLDPEPQHGRLMAELPRRTPVRPRLQSWDDALWTVDAPGHCAQCGHRWVAHIGHTRVCDATLGKDTCGCTQQPGSV